MSSKYSKWWKTATEEEKLVQVISGRDLGMTQKIIAKNLGCSHQTISAFAYSHDIKFETYRLTLRRLSQYQQHSFDHSRRWAERRGQDLASSTMAPLFPKQNNDNLFEEYSHE